MNLIIWLSLLSGVGCVIAAQESQQMELDVTLVGKKIRDVRTGFSIPGKRNLQASVVFEEKQNKEALIESSPELCGEVEKEDTSISDFLSWLDIDCLSPALDTLFSPEELRETTEKKDLGWLDRSWIDALMSTQENKKIKLLQMFEVLENLLEKDLVAGGGTKKEIQKLKGLPSPEKQYIPMLSFQFGKDAQYEIVGDLHGDFGPIDALLRQLIVEGKYDKERGLLAKDVHLFFLGDFIDRGKESIKNLWYLTFLKKRNPLQVHLVRGNHEDLDVFFRYGFRAEVENFLGLSISQVFSVLQKADSVFRLLPQMISVNCSELDYRFVFVHGGIPFRLSFTEREDFAYFLQADKKLKAAILSFDSCKNESQFLWNDISFEGFDQTLVSSRSSDCYKLGKIDVIEFLTAFKINTLFRGHQQEGASYFSKGKWKGLVASWAEGDPDRTITANVASDTGIYNLPGYDYYCEQGTWLRVASCVLLTPVADDDQTSNTVARTLDSTPNMVLKPMYFDSKTHKMVFVK